MGKIMTSTLLLLFLSLALKLSAALQCPNTWTAFGESCYKLIEEQTSWYDAHIICNVAGSKMIQIDSKAENDFAVQLARQLGNSVWIGLNDLIQEGHFVQDDTRQSPTFTNWSPQQPDNWLASEDCVHVNHFHNYLWNDYNCDSKYSTICEKHVKY